MPNPILDPKYKGQAFSKIAEAIQSKYKDRYDPISKRGEQAEMNSLREEQEYVRQKQQIQQELEQQLAAPQQDMQQDIPMQAPQAPTQGANIPMQEQPEQFNREASASYNQQFAYGGKIKYQDGGIMDTRPNVFGAFDQGLVDAGLAGEMSLQNTTGSIDNINQTQGLQGGSPLRYAPLVGNLANIITARRTDPTQQRLREQGLRTQVDENLATQVAPRQTQFDRVDFAPIERGIQQQARGFTASNRAMSAGNAGAFTANELANQGNIMNAIAQARMQQQQGDQRTGQLNAAEQARIDAFRQQQSMQQAGLQGQNLQAGMNMLNIDDANEGAYQNFVRGNVAGLTEGIGNIGREQDLMRMISTGTGYDRFGNYFQPGQVPEDSTLAFINNILRRRNR